MRKYKNSKLIYFAMAVVILLCIFIPINSTGAWFTSGSGKQLECIVHIKNINLSVFQKFSTTTDDGVLIKTFEQNETSDEKSYVDLTENGTYSTILPDQSYNLHLTLNNQDTVDSSLYVRFKIELLVCDATQDYSLNMVLSGTTAPTSTKNGFVISPDGYYYYQNSAGVRQTYESEAKASILTSFVVPYSEFNTNGDITEIGGNNVKLKLTIEGSASSDFN